MFTFFKKIFCSKNRNLIAVLDIWSSLIKCLILDVQKWKIISHWESKQAFWAIKNWLITDLKSVIFSVNEALEDWENKLWEPVSSVYFWLNWDFETFSNKSFQWHIKTISDEIWGKFLGFFSLSSCYFAWIKDQKNYLIIDIWSDLTSLSLIKNWMHKKCENFWLWWDIFTKRISKIFTTSFSEAEKTKLLFSLWKIKNSNLSNEDFKLDLDLWLTALFVSLKNLWEKNLPSNIFLTGSGSLFRPIIERLRNEEEFYKKLNFESKPSIKLLTFAGLPFSKTKKEETIIPWIPIRIFADFILKIQKNNKKI